MKYKAAIFDLDGTLINSLHDLTSSVNFALEKFSYPKRSIDEIRSFIGDGVKMLIRRAVPKDVSDDKALECLDVFKKHYSEHMIEKTVPYEGIFEVLKNLKKSGIKIGVVSNKFDTAVKEICKSFFGNLIDSAVGDSPARKRKPAPDGVILCMNELNISKKEVFYIGDTETDKKTSENAGTDFIGASWGYRDKDFFNKMGEKNIADKPGDILNFFDLS